MLEQFKEDNELFHSSFQIENFILIKNGKTLFGIYKQCLRELISREGSLRTIYAQKMKHEIDFEELEENLKRAIKEDPNSYNVRRMQINRAEMAYGMRDVLKVIRETEREYTHFYNAGVILKNKLGEITPEKRKVLEEELWIEQCKYKACADIRMTRNISVETMGIVDSLPNKNKEDLQNFFFRIQQNTPTGKDELNYFLASYSKNFEFGSELDKALEFNIKKLVENNG